jgi:DME family drug/metabolite transporter
MNQKNVGSLQVMIAGVLWATHGTIVSFLPAAVPTLALATIRLIIGGAGLGLILVLSGQKTLFNGNKNIPYPSIILAGVAQAITQVSVYYGIRNAGVTVATMIFIASPPVISGLFSQFVKKERQSLSWLVSAIIIVIGSLLMAFSADRVADGNGLVIGSLFGLIAGTCWTFTGSQLRSLNKVASPMVSSFIVVTLAGIFLLPIALTKDLSWIKSWNVLFLSLLLGLMATSFPFFLFTTGSRKIEASHAFLYNLSEPITASLLGFLVLNEKLSSIGVVGYILVVAGLFIFSLWEFRKQGS